MGMAKFVAHASDYTDQELLDLWRAASAEVAFSGVSYRIRDRELRQSQAGEIREMILFYEKRVNAAAGNGSGENVIRFRRPQ